jgi:hypothetical protein
VSGTDEPPNLVAACADCNLQKSDRTALEFVNQRLQAGAHLARFQRARVEPPRLSTPQLGPRTEERVSLPACWGDLSGPHYGGAVKDAAAQAQAVIREMLKDAPRAPRPWRYVAGRMAGDFEAPAAWERLGGSREVVQKVLDMVRQSFEQASREVHRPSAAAERDDIQRVVQLAKSLRLAIRNSSLPADTLQHGAALVGNYGRPDLPIDFGWHSVQPGHSIAGYWLTVEEMLDWTIAAADAHLSRLPARSVQRKSSRREPQVTAFVRYLAWHFGRHLGQEMWGTIGHIASAVFDLKVPLDESNVEAMLKDRPEVFRPHLPKS